MYSDFLDKFKGKTNKIPKEGMVNLIDATHKKPIRLIVSTPKQTKHMSSQKPTQTKKKKSKITSSTKQNKPYQHPSYTANQIKHSLQKSVHKNKQILSLKQNHKPLHLNNNVKKQLLKLPKINKPNLPNNVQSVRQTSKQPIKSHIKQKNDSNFVPQKAPQKLKRNILTETRQLKPQRPKVAMNSLESMLDDEALIQLKKLNNLELIVQEIQLKRRQQMEHQELHNSRYNRKGLTIHY